MIPGLQPHIERPVTARPPLGGLGTMDRYPLGKRRKNHFVSHFFLVNEPLLPAQAVGGPWRRWSWEPQARPYDQPPFPFLPPENGVSRKNLLPLGVLSLFLQEIGPRQEGSVPARSNGDGKNPHRSLPPTQRKKPRRETQLPPRSPVVCRLFYHGLTQPHENGGRLGAGGAALGFRVSVTR